MSPRMRKLCRHNENTAPVLLAVFVLQALPSNGFTCHNIFHNKAHDYSLQRYNMDPQFFEQPWYRSSLCLLARMEWDTDGTFIKILLFCGALINLEN
jgi:hypothetical protein